MSDSEKPYTIQQVMDLPDSLLVSDFDVYCVTAEESVSRQLNENLATVPNYLSVMKVKITLDHATASLSNRLSLDVSAHSLIVEFADLDFNQEQLDARAALTSSPLSSMIIRQRTSKGAVSRFIEFSDLNPGRVEFKLDAAGSALANRTVVWKFKSVKEYKEFPG